VINNHSSYQSSPQGGDGLYQTWDNVFRNLELPCHAYAMAHTPQVEKLMHSHFFCFFHFYFILYSVFYCVFVFPFFVFVFVFFVFLFYVLCFLFILFSVSVVGFPKIAPIKMYIRFRLRFHRTRHLDCICDIGEHKNEMTEGMRACANVYDST